MKWCMVKTICQKQKIIPDWVKSMIRLENNFETETIKKNKNELSMWLRNGRKIALVMELKSDSSNIEEFANTEKAKRSRAFCKDGELFLQFDFCPCPMLSEVDKLETNTWCQCTT